MQQIRWTAFGVSSAITKTAVHFFPSARTTSAPYPILVKLSVFAKDFPAKSLVIEGGRLGQPDGFRIEEAFPALSELLPGFLAIDIELSSPQPRLDLSASGCIIEVISTSQSVKYAAARLSEALARSSSVSTAGSNSVERQSLPAINDAYGVASILVVNNCDTALQPFVALAAAFSKVRPVVAAFASEPIADVALERIPANDILANSIAEISIHDNLFHALQPEECSWGLVRNRVLIFDKVVAPGVACYLLYRESVTKRIISVLPL